MPASSHSDLYRVRVGDYRVVYAVDDAGESDEVRRIAQRGDVYR
ncbi:MAG: type II toxin-antitoxin system RelE/ParE family toxin [Acidobacteria bacterium]|nr:type II toxin-antitoxin system RelE/ParE family toxin [Acidobacteriota bacterium]